MVDDQIKPNMSKMQFFHNFIELCSLQHFQSITIDVKNFVRFNFCMATLYQAFVSKILAVFGVLTIFLIIKPFHFSFPFFLNNFNYSILLSLLFCCCESGFGCNVCIVSQFNSWRQRICFLFKHLDFVFSFFNCDLDCHFFSFFRLNLDFFKRCLNLTNSLLSERFELFAQNLSNVGSCCVDWVVF